MRLGLEERCIAMAEYLIWTHATVRGVSRMFGVSKTTVHRELTVRLCEIDKFLANDTRAVLEQNKAERHIRGGLATRLKYKGMPK